MTPLVALIVVVLVAVMAANLVGRARAGVRSVRSHHRALDTLGDITTRRPPPGAPSTPQAVSHQAHVRILWPEIELREPEEPIVEEVPEPAAAIVVPFRLPPPPRNDLWDTAAVSTTNGHQVSPGGELELTVSPSNGDGSGVDDDRRSDEDGSDQKTVVARVDDGQDGDDRAADGERADGDDVIDVDRLDGRRAGDGVGGGAPELPASIWPSVRVRRAHPARGTGSHGQVIGATRTPLAVFAAAGDGRRARAPEEQSSRRRTAVASTGILAVAAVGVFLVLDHHHEAPPAATSTHPVTTKAPVATTATTVAIKAPTSTVEPTPVRLISSRPGTAVYRLTKGTRVTFSATSACWMEVRHADSTGRVVSTAILAAGAKKSVTGPVWIRVGDPSAVVVRAAGVTVSPPAIKGQPYDLQFDT